MPSTGKPCNGVCEACAGITVSQEQLLEAQARVKAAGLSDRVQLLFCDYRDVPARFGAGAFDAVIRRVNLGQTRRSLTGAALSLAASCMSEAVYSDVGNQCGARAAAR